MTLSKEDPLAKRLILDEAWRNYPYVDSKGYWTLGVGHLIDRRKGGSIPEYIKAFPLRDDEVLRMLEEDIFLKTQGLFTRFPWMQQLDGPRQRVFLNMAFQMGVGGVAGFGNALSAAKAGDWATCAKEMRDSDWRREDTPQRAERLAIVMETGKEPF